MFYCLLLLFCSIYLGHLLEINTWVPCESLKFRVIIDAQSGLKCGAALGRYETDAAYDNKAAIPNCRMVEIKYNRTDYQGFLASSSPSLR